MLKWLAIVFAVGAVASPALAQDPAVAGAWLLSANVSNNPYNLICHFEQTGDHLGGNCVEAEKNGEAAKDAHPLHLTAGKIDGGHVAFSHPGHYFVMSFNVNYAGVVEGDHMTGKINVFGHKGSFTAVRNDGKVELASLEGGVDAR